MSQRSIKKNFWDIFDKARGIGVDFQAFLLIIILFKENILYEYLKKDESDFHAYVFQKIQELPVKESQLLNEVANLFKTDLSNLDYQHIRFIQDSLEQSDSSIKSTFDTLLFLLNDVMGKIEGEHVQPDEISELMIELADLKSRETVYNPFAGLASFGTKLKDTNGYIGQELNNRTYYMAMLRLIAYDKLDISDLRREDSIHNWISDQRFDLTVASLPFGLRINRSLYNNIDSNTVEHFYLKESINSIKYTGKSIALISDGVLFRSGKEKQLREWLVENDFIESIISLPGKLLYNTSIPSNIIVLGKNKEKKGYIKMLDASNMIEEKQKGHNRVIVEKVLENYRSNKRSEHLRLVSNIEVEENDFNLTVSRYFAENLSDVIEGVRLREIITPVKGRKIKDKSNVKYLKIGDLNDHNIGVYADLDSLEIKEDKMTGFQVNKPVLLLAKRFNLKPTILESPIPNLVISNDIRAFEVNQKKVDIGYLVFELRKKYVQNQIEKYQTGTNMPYLSVDDLFKIKIKLPSKKEQSQCLLDEINRRAKNELNKYSKELSGMKADLFKEFSSTRHSVKQYLNSIRGAVNGLKKYITLNDGDKIHLDDIYSKNLNNTLNDHLQKLIDDTVAAAKLLDKLETPFLKGTKEKLNIIELTKEAMNKFWGSKEFKYADLYVDESSFLIDGQDEVKPIIEINREDYFKLLQNIVDNACNHGFKNDMNNIIRIEISSIDGGKYVMLEISNNGKPFDEKFTEERLKIRGEKSVSSESTGNGGADIDQIVKLYGGKFNIDLDSEKEFPVKYLIQFPIQIESVE